MPSSVIILLVMSASIGLAVLGLHLVRRRVPDPVRRANNEVAGHFLGVLGVIYAVLLAFVVLDVWEQFEEARLTVEQEANAVASLYRVSVGLPEPTGSRLRALAREYAEVMVAEEWPAMASGQLGAASQPAIDALWSAAIGYQPTSDGERLLQSELLDHLSDLNDARRLRELAARNALPGTIWGLLAGGAVVSVIFTYFFSSSNPRAQYVMTALYVASISFVLVLIGLFDHPFTGDVRVGTEAFESVIRTIGRLEGQPR